MNQDVKVWKQLQKHGTAKDLEKFSALMKRAHSRGIMAVQLVRENGRITTSKLIRILCSNE